MIDIYLCEDNKIQLNFYKEMIQQFVNFHSDYFRNVQIFETPETLLKMVHDFSHPAIFFIDILLGDNHMNGFSLAKTIRKHSPDSGIIFLTTEAALAYKSFDYQLNVLDYIVKKPEHLLNTKENELLRKRISRVLTQYASAHIYLSSKMLTLFCGSQILKIPFSHILCASAQKGRHQIELITNTQKINAKISLKELMLQLDTDFTYCNKSCIINRNKIISLDTHNRILTLHGNIHCEIAVREMKKIRDYFLNQ